VPGAKVVILTVYQDDEYLFNAVKAGAVGYILKDVSPEQLVHAVRLASRGESLIDPALAARVLAEFSKLSTNGERTQQGATGVYAALTPREMQVLNLVAQGKSNKEIARELCIEEKTVKNHMSNIFAKLQVNDRTQALIYAVRHGLVKL